MPCREEVSVLERNKYKFSPLELPDELPALFHGETTASFKAAPTVETRLTRATGLTVVNVKVGRKKKSVHLPIIRFSV